MNAVQTQSAAQAMPFRFTGNGGEYFRIWIVNLFLSIITLGIYSAWAKVRRNRYFYGNTRLGNAGFDYLADPKAILRGRLIAVGVFAVYSVVTNIWPLTAFAFMAVFAAVVPWVIVRSLVFRARNTAFRNVRFNFTGTYGEAIKVFILWPLLIVFTLGLIFPYVDYRQKKLIVANSAYGTAPFTFNARVGEFYRVYGKALLFVLAMLAVIAALTASTAGMLKASVSPEASVTAAAVIVPIVMGVFMSAMYLFLFAYMGARVSNLAYNGTRLEGHGLRSTLRARDLFMLYLTNTLGIIFTLGLFIPWAQVRMARYRAERMQFLPQGDLDRFVAASQAKVGSTGEEMGEMFDLGVAI
jgi:uncharacterized membrane protein YjgN (DUF898 family)